MPITLNSLRNAFRNQGDNGHLDNERRIDNRSIRLARRDGQQNASDLANAKVRAAEIAQQNKEASASSQARREVWKGELIDTVKQLQVKSDPGTRASGMTRAAVLMNHLGASEDEIRQTLAQIQAAPQSSLRDPEATQTNNALIDKAAIQGADPNTALEVGQASGRLPAGLAAPPPAPRKTTTLSRGAQLRDEETGELIATNTNATPSTSRVGVQKQRLDRAIARKAAVDEETANDESLSSLMRQAMSEIDVGRAEQTFSASEAKSMRADLKKRGEALIRYDRSAKVALDVLDSSGASAGIAGNAANAFLGMASNMKSLASLIPGADPEIDLEPGRWIDQLTSLGVGNQELRSAMFSIALQDAVASGLANGRLSNQAIKLAMKNVAVEANTPTKIKAKLREVRARLKSNLRTALDFQLGEFSGLDAADPQSAPSTLKNIDEMTLEELNAELAL